MSQEENQGAFSKLFSISKIANITTQPVTQTNQDSDTINEETQAEQKPSISARNGGGIGGLFGELKNALISQQTTKLENSLFKKQQTQMGKSKIWKYEDHIMQNFNLSSSVANINNIAKLQEVKKAQEGPKDDKKFSQLFAKQETKTNNLNQNGTGMGGISSLGALLRSTRPNENQKPDSHYQTERLNRFEFQCQLPIQESQIPIKPPPNPNLAAVSPSKSKQTEKPENVQLQPISFMGLNYMSKQIMYQTNQSLCLFSITKSKVTTQRTFADILNEPQGKSELYTIENIQPLILKNCWVTVKNKKQLLFFNSHLDKGTDPAADQNGIYDVKVNQKSEEIYTLTKDFKQIRIWVYEIQDKQPRKFNSDRHIKRFQSFEVVLSNRKNIYFNMGLLQFNLINEMDVLVCQSSIVNEISVWNINEGVILYNFSMDDYQKLPSGEEEFSGSSFTKDFAQKQGQSAQKTQEIASKSIHDRKFNFNAVTTFQEFVIVYSNNQKKLIIWDIIKKEAIMVRHLKHLKGPIIQLFVECSIDIFSGGILLMNEDGLIYEFSIARGRIYSNAYDSKLRQQHMLPPNELVQSPKIKHVMSQFFVHQQHKKLKELEQLYPHSFQDNDYQILQNAYKLYFLMIENGCRQLYILREQSIDIVEMFQPAYSVYEYHPNQEQNLNAKITEIFKEEINMHQEKNTEFLVIHNNYGEITFQRLDQIRQIDESKGGCYKALTNNDCFLKITYKEILQKCIDASTGNSPNKAGGKSTRSSKELNDFPSPNQQQQNGTHDKLRSSLFSGESTTNRVKFKQTQLDDSIQIFGGKVTTKFKIPNYENFLTADIVFSDIDFDLGILVFYNQDGMLAIINFYTMVRKFLQLGLQGNINKIKIIEKDNHDNNFYLVKKASIKNFSLNDYHQLLEKKKQHFDDLTYVADPNYSIIFVCENDIIEIKNDSKSNTCGFKNKISFNEKVVDTFYFKNRLQMFAICRDGTVREIETESFTIKRFFRLQWQEISCSFMNISGETTLICGHDKGIITSEVIDQDKQKSNSLERKFQLHNFHRKQIISISQPPNVTNQFVSLCQERIVCIWLIDNERPLKALYFGNSFNYLMAFTEHNSRFVAGGVLSNLPNIDRVMLIGDNRIFEIDTRAAPYYRSYNEEVQYEWECFTFELSKQVQNMKKNIQDTKSYENEKRFDLNKVNQSSLMSLKQEILRRFQAEKEGYEMDTVISENQEETKIVEEQSNSNKKFQSRRKTITVINNKQQSITANSFQANREDFLAIMNSFMSNTSLDTLPQRLLDIEYHHFLKRSNLSQLSDLEKIYLQQYLNIDYQYLKILRNLTRDQIMQLAKHPQDRDKTSIQLQKIKDQNKLISAEMNKQYDISYRRKDEEQNIMLKTQELKQLNQKRKNNPSLMMGLITMPPEQQNINSNLNNGKDIAVVQQDQERSLQSQNLRQGSFEDIKIEAKRMTMESQERDSKISKQGTQNEQILNPKQQNTNQIAHKSQSIPNLKSNFHIKLPQITINDYKKELVSIRDSLRSREINLMSNQNSFYSFKQGLSTRKNSSEVLNRNKLMSGGISQKPEEETVQMLYIAAETNFITQPPHTSRRTDHFLSGKDRIQNEFNNKQALQVKIEGYNTQRDILTERKDKLDTSPPKNFPKRSLNNQDKKLSSQNFNPMINNQDQGFSKITESTNTEKFQNNSMSKVSNFINLPTGHHLLLNSQLTLENQSQIIQDYTLSIRSNKTISGKQRFFQNQRLQNEILKPLISDQSLHPHISTQTSQQHIDIHQIQIPQIKQVINLESSHANINQPKFISNEPIINVLNSENDKTFEKQDNSLIHALNQNQLIQMKSNNNNTKVVDARQFWQNYQEKLNQIKSNQNYQLKQSQSARSLPLSTLQNQKMQNQHQKSQSVFKDLVLNSQTAKFSVSKINSNKQKQSQQILTQTHNLPNQPISLQNRGTNPMNNSSQAQMSTETNSKIINEQSVEEEEGQLTTINQNLMNNQPGSNQEDQKQRDKEEDSQMVNQINLQSYDARLTQRSHDSDLQNYLDELKQDNSQVHNPNQNSITSQNKNDYKNSRPNGQNLDLNFTNSKGGDRNVLSQLDPIKIARISSQGSLNKQNQQQTSHIVQQQNSLINIIDQKKANTNDITRNDLDKEDQKVKQNNLLENPYIDNIAYIEGFFNFKVDPVDLVDYFDKHDIDVETLTKDQIKQILLDYLELRRQAHLSKLSELEQKQQYVQRVREENKQHKMQMEELQRIKQQQAKQQIINKDKRVFQDIFKKYSIEQQRFLQFFEGKTSPLNSPQLPNQNSKRLLNRSELPLVDQNQKKKQQQELNRKQLEQFIKTQIIEKWMMRKVNKCIELLDHGMDKVDVLSKVCPEGVFDEQVHDQNGQMWKHNKIKKQKMKQNNAKNIGGMFGDYNNDANYASNNIGQGSQSDGEGRRPGSQSQQNSELGVMLKIETRKQQAQKQSNMQQNSISQDEYQNTASNGFQLGDGTSTLHLRQGSQDNQSQFDEQLGSATPQIHNYNSANDEEREKELLENPNKNKIGLLTPSKQINKYSTKDKGKSTSLSPGLGKLQKKGQNLKVNIQNNNKRSPIQSPTISRKSTINPKNDQNPTNQKNKSKFNNNLPLADPMSKIDQPSQIIYEHEHESMMDGTSSINVNKAFLFNEKQGNTFDKDRKQQRQGGNILDEQSEEDDRDKITFQKSQDQNNQHQTFDSLLSSSQRNQTADREHNYFTQNPAANDFFSGMMMAQKLATDDEQTSNVSGISIQIKGGVRSSRDNSPRNNFLSNRARVSKLPGIETGSMSLKDRLSRSLKKKVQYAEQKSDRTMKNQTNILSSLKPGYPDSSSGNQDIRTEQGDAPTSQNPILKIITNSALKLVSNKNSSQNKDGGNTNKRKSALSKQGGDDFSTANEDNSKSPMKKRMTVKRMSQKKLSLQKDGNDPSLKNQKTTIDEQQSEDSQANIRIDLSQADLPNLKDKLFGMISDKIFELSPSNRIEQIKLAATLEQLGLDQLQEIGIQLNSRRDNYAEIIQKLKTYMKNQERINAGVKINKKTFTDLQKRLLPNQNIGAQDFVNLLKVRGSGKSLFKKNPKKMTSIDQLNVFMNRAIYQMSEIGDEPMYSEDQVTSGPNSSQDQQQNIKCDEILAKLFEKDQDFNYFQGRLKEYRMKFGQQTQFVESAKDVQDSDRRDYATFDRLEAFRKNQESLKAAYSKSKKLETTKGLVKDVPALSGENNNGVQEFGHYYINIEGNGADKPDEKFSLNSLCDDIYNMFLEVKRKNKRLGVNALGDKKSIDNRKHPNLGDDRSSSVGPGESQQSAVDDTMNSDHILRKYKLNLEQKKRLDEMSSLERSERKYGIMVKNDPEYLNPTFSQKYLERQQFKSFTARDMLSDNQFNSKKNMLKLPDISGISKLSQQSLIQNNIL